MEVYLDIYGNNATTSSVIVKTGEAMIIGDWPPSLLWVRAWSVI